jgi:glycosyltransferase involved in cell wall biosynthesis
MKVLHVIPSIGRDQAGLRSGVIGICRALLSVGITPEIACVGGSAADDPPGIQVHRFAAGSRLLHSSRGLRDWLLARANDYAAIVAHVVWLAPAHYAAEAAAAAGMPLYLASHGMLDPDALAHHRLRKLVRWHLGVRKLVGRSVLLFTSQADRQRALSNPGLRDAPSVVVPNSVDWPESTQPGTGIACLNRLHPRKGVLEWVEALRLMPDPPPAVHAGVEQDAAYATEVRARAGKLVVFRGVLDETRAAALIAAAQVVVHPAVGFENFGNVIIEAMAAGKAVVASRRALVTPELEAAGVVIGTEPEPAALAAAMQAALADDGLGARAREYARAHFTHQVVGRQWAELLRG